MPPPPTNSLGNLFGGGLFAISRDLELARRYGIMWFAIACFDTVSLSYFIWRVSYSDGPEKKRLLTDRSLSFFLLPSVTLSAIYSSLSYRLRGNTSGQRNGLWQRRYS